MGSSYRRLEVQLPQFFREAQREAATCASEVLRMEEQVEANRVRAKGGRGRVSAAENS